MSLLKIKKEKTRKANLQFAEIYNIDETILYENTGTKFIQGKLDTLQEQENTEERDHLITCLEDEKKIAFTEQKK